MGDVHTRGRVLERMKKYKIFEEMKFPTFSMYKLGRWDMLKIENDVAWCSFEYILWADIS